MLSGVRSGEVSSSLRISALVSVPSGFHFLMALNCHRPKLCRAKPGITLRSIVGDRTKENFRAPDGPIADILRNDSEARTPGDRAGNARGHLTFIFLSQRQLRRCLKTSIEG
jgi:hypothetical protein